MKNWYSASELMGLPGLPGSKQGVIDVAKRNAWIHRPRAGRGGGKEYAIASLPSVTQQHLIWRGMPAIRHLDTDSSYRNAIMDELQSWVANTESTRKRRTFLQVCRVLLGVALAWIGQRLLSAAEALNEERTS